jgi:hypothetical protein
MEKEEREKRRLQNLSFEYFSSYMVLVNRNLIKYYSTVVVVVCCKVLAVGSTLKLDVIV